MTVDTPASADVPIQLAATVLALSPRGSGFDVLMVRRESAWRVLLPGVADFEAAR
ncbi:MAG: hypothetical protein WD184_04040 [Acidimicrobiia bacterium]